MPYPVAAQYELVPDVEVVASFGDSAADAAVVELLGIVHVVSAGVAGGVEVADVTNRLVTVVNNISPAATPPATTGCSPSRTPGQWSRRAGDRPASLKLRRTL